MINTVVTKTLYPLQI